jgi:hypothetical protein
MTKLEAWKAWCESAGTPDLATEFTLEQSSHGKAFSFAWERGFVDGMQHQMQLSVKINKQPTKIFGPGLEELLNSAGFYRKREWVGLTADEIWKCNKAKSGSAVEFHICYAHQNVLDFAESIEAKLKEKNT